MAEDKGWTLPAPVVEIKGNKVVHYLPGSENAPKSAQKAADKQAEAEKAEAQAEAPKVGGTQ